jgi:hypothetical protein
MTLPPAPPHSPLPWLVACTVQAYQWLLLACPRDFRHAYGREMVLVFRQCCQDAYRQQGWRGVVALWLPTFMEMLAGAIADYGTAIVLAFARRNQVNRLRRVELTVFWTFPVFALGYLGLLILSQSATSFVGYTQYTQVLKYYLPGLVAHLTGSPLPAPQPVSAHNGVFQQPGAGTAIPLQGVVVCAIVALLAILALGLSISFAALRRAIAARQIRVLLLLAVPILALALVLGYTLLLEKRLESGPRVSSVDPSTFSGFLSVGLANLGLSYWGQIALVGLATLVSMAALSKAITRVQISERSLRFARIPAVLATVAMGAALGSVLLWGVNGFDWTALGQGGTDSPAWYGWALLWWGGASALMALSAGIAAFSIVCSFRGRALSNSPLSATS